MHVRIIAALVLAALVAAPADASRTNCPQYFVEREAPDLVNARLSRDTRELCYSAFAVLHSGVTRTPLWSAEHLTQQALSAARATIRLNRFHAEPHLPRTERAELSDYARSGYDRGHMAPSGDMPTPEAQRESFSLANMIPQNPDNNRGLWEGIESAVRNLVRDGGELYVVTGPIFAGETLQRLNGRVLVPTAIFKAVYDPRRHQAAAYLVPNVEGKEWQIVPIAELTKMVGVDVFPALPDAIKQKTMQLPAPTPHGYDKESRR